MNAPAGVPKILVIDSNVYFTKKLSESLKQEGFDVAVAMQAAYALTMLEWDTPAAIVCATNLREMGALEIARILRADAKTANIPVIALGDGGEQALMAAFSAGCDDYVDRSRGAAHVASHLRRFLLSRQEGFQPTQMLALSETALTGNLSHLDLPGVVQMLGQARQTGVLHINAGETDAVIFFEAGEISHAEFRDLFGDEAVMQILKNCQAKGPRLYNFVYGATASNRTVLRSATDLMLDAMRELDENERDKAEKEST